MFVFFFQAEDGIRDYKVTGVQTCALPISPLDTGFYYDIALDTPISSNDFPRIEAEMQKIVQENRPFTRYDLPVEQGIDRKSTRLNSSHLVISYAVFCLKKKNNH